MGRVKVNLNIHSYSPNFLSQSPNKAANHSQRTVK